MITMEPLALSNVVALSGLDKVPAPAETPCEVIVSGRTSTLKSIKVVNIGQQIPRTFSGKLVRNTPGFTWYVSEHYALKTDFPAKTARLHLTLLELAYPHYVALFGREIPAIGEKRMACIFGSTFNKLLKAMLSDDMHWGPGGGGITQEGYRCAYQFPSNIYHSRYIIIHEATHLYQYCLVGDIRGTPGWFIEGIADALSSHVYDAKHKRLTVNCLDRAPVHNFFEYGAEKLRKDPELTLHKIHKQGGSDRGVNVLIVQYLRHSSEFAQKWRTYIDEMFRTATVNNQKEVSDKLVQSLYGPWKKINAGFREWLGERTRTFHQAHWGFDQTGNTLLSLPRSNDPGFAHMDINIIPKKAPEKDIFRMDYPAEKTPPIVGPVQRGVAEPSIACVVDFSDNPGKGAAGLGLGVSGRKSTKCLKLLIDKGTALVVDGRDFGMRKKTIALPQALRRAMKRGGHRIGLTAKIGKKRLEVTLRAGKKDSMEEFSALLVLNDKLRRRIMSGPLAALGTGGRHRITPFLDDGRPLPPNLNVSAPLNRWRNAGGRQLNAVYKACWRLGKNAPASLRQSKNLLFKAANGGPEPQAEALSNFDESLPQIVRDVRNCGAGAKTVNLVLTEMTGLALDLVLGSTKKANQCRITTIVRGPLSGGAKGTVRLKCGLPGTVKAKLNSEPLCLEAGEEIKLAQTVSVLRSGLPFFVEAEAKLFWHGVPITLRTTKIGNASIPHFWIIGPFDNKGKVQDIPHPIEKEPLNFEKLYAGQCGNNVSWRKVERSREVGVEDEHLVHMIHHFGQANHSAAYALVWINAPRATRAILAVGASDGIVVWLNDKRLYGRIVARDWSPRADRVPIRLRKGRNKLLMKSVHGGALWFLSAHIEDKHGRPLKDVTTTLEGE